MSNSSFKSLRGNNFVLLIHKYSEYLSRLKDNTVQQSSDLQKYKL